MRRPAASRRRRVLAAHAARTSTNGSGRRAHHRARTADKPIRHRGAAKASRPLPQTKRQPDPQYLAAIKNFETAARYFRRENFGKAKEIFEKLVESPTLEVAARARVHLRLCGQKLDRSALGAKTADDHYNLGVSKLNSRRLEEAVGHLAKANKLAPNREHVRYALAAAHALQGKNEAALEHLKAAITLRPENRFHARHDEDFGSLAADPRFKRLVISETIQTSF